MKNFILLYFLLFLLSCNKKHPDYYHIKYFTSDDLPPAIVLKGQKMNVKGILNPRNILNLENCLVVSERKADTLIHIIDKKNFQVIRKVGIPGRGPGEIGSPWVLYKANSPNEFWAFSLSENKMSKFNASLNNVFAEEDIKFVGDMRLARNFVVLDSTYMLMLVDGNDKFVEFSKNGTKVNTYDTWDHMVDKEMPFNIISSLYDGKLNVSPNKRYCVFSSIKSDIIEILDTREGTIKSIWGPLNHMPKFKIDYSPGYPMAAFDERTKIYKYSHTVLTDEFIYAAFSGATSAQVNKSGEKYCNDVFIFDYEGKIKGHYILESSISALAVDELNKKFYGLTFDLEPNVIVFDF